MCSKYVRDLLISNCTDEFNLFEYIFLGEPVFGWKVFEFDYSSLEHFGHVHIISIKVMHAVFQWWNSLPYTYTWCTSRTIEVVFASIWKRIGNKSRQKARLAHTLIENTVPHYVSVECREEKTKNINIEMGSLISLSWFKMNRFSFFSYGTERKKWAKEKCVKSSNHQKRASLSNQHTLFCWQKYLATTLRAAFRQEKTVCVTDTFYAHTKFQSFWLNAMCLTNIAS